jgi:glycerol-3-phosphate dehydrogenase (NAD(P)+)
MTNNRLVFNRIIILGNTSWGTTLANQFAKICENVIILTRTIEDANEINDFHENMSYLSGVILRKNIQATNDWSIVNANDLLVIAIPSTAMRECLLQIPQSKDIQVLCATKGLDSKTGMRMSEVIYEILNVQSLAVISGPNLSTEINNHLPSATVVASESDNFAITIQDCLHKDNFRVYISNDVIGVELGGALKNIVAIAAGIVDAFKYGDNAKSGLLTRGLAEISRLTIAAGGDPISLQGLAGIGDLMATSFSQHSRNRRFGEFLGNGYSVSQALEKLDGIAEGYTTLPSAMLLAKKYNVELPIFSALSSIINDSRDPSLVIESLLSRDPRQQ